MIKLENVSVFNFENAIRGMRNPMNSWKYIDSDYDENGNYVIGPKDLELMQNLIHSGTPHDKFMRQILVSVDITAPLYWWKEMDTYKVATVANSTSTMHKIHSKPIELSDFSFDLPLLPNDEDAKKILEMHERIRDDLEWLRNKYLETKEEVPVDNPYWRTLIQTLPDGYMQTRTWTANYATLRGMYKWRKNHKQIEWRQFCEVLVGEPTVFPYGKELIAYELD